MKVQAEEMYDATKSFRSYDASFLVHPEGLVLYSECARVESRSIWLALMSCTFIPGKEGEV